VEGQPHDLVFARLALRNVHQHADAMPHRTALVAHGVDGQPGGVDLAALAPLPHLALPVAVGAQLLPQPCEEGRVMVVGTEDGGGLADEFFGREADDVAIGLVGAQDDAFGIGDDDAFLRFEGRRGDAHLGFGAAAQRDVGDRHAQRGQRFLRVRAQHVQLRRQCLSTGTGHRQLDAPRAAFAPQAPGQAVPVVAVGFRDVEGEARAHQRSVRLAEQQGGGAVRVEHGAVGVEREIAHGREFVEVAVAVACRFHRRLCAVQFLVLHLELDAVHLQFVQHRGHVRRRRQRGPHLGQLGFGAAAQTFGFCGGDAGGTAHGGPAFRQRC